MYYLRDEVVRELLDMDRAIAAMRIAFKEQGEGAAFNLPRQRLPSSAESLRTASRALNVLPGTVPGSNAFGVLLYTGNRGWPNPRPPRFVSILYSRESGEITGMVESDAIVDIATGAVSAVATDALANADADELGIIGCGEQARTQVEGIAKVRRLKRVRAWSPTQARRERFAEEVSRLTGVPVEVAASGEAAVKGVPVVVTATTAFEPVLLGRWLAPGAHVNAIGANWTNKREIDGEVVARSELVVVDSLPEARTSCGDLLRAIDEGSIAWDDVHELGDVLAGRVGRRTESDVTLFESHGISIEYLAVAARLLEDAKKTGQAEHVPLFAD